MGYVALYRKWRPMVFDDVVEQDGVVTILKNSVKSDRIAHAYLFCGTRGTGKTTLAKIFARAINCLNPSDGNPCNACEICRGILSQQILDVSEIDAASNNGVDNIRSIIDEAAYSAARAKYKVFIIDEVHMLSTGAFNALLKTLEEPPENVVFILATTEPHKLPVTILSRCQRYDFKRISRDGIVRRLEEICQSLSVEYDRTALSFLAQKADGAMRDAISLLDQTLASCGNKMTLQAARMASGSLDKAFLEQFADHLLSCDGTALLQDTDQIFADGRDPSNFISELMGLLRNMLIVLTVRDPGDLIYEDAEGLARLRQMAARTSSGELTLMIRELSKLDNQMKWALQRKILFETGMLSLCDRKWSSDAELKQRIDYLEERLSDLIAAGLKITAHPSAGNAAGRGGDGADRSDESADSLSAASEAGIRKAPNAVRDMPGEIPLPEPPTFPPEALCDGQVRPEKPPHMDSRTAQPVSAGKNAGRNTEEDRKSQYPIPADEPDWRDFLAEISQRKKPSVSALINMNGSGWLTSGSELCIAFATKSIRDMVLKSDCVKLLEEAAQAAFGKALHIRLIERSELETAAAESSKADAAGRDQQAEEAAPATEPAAIQRTAESGGAQEDEQFRKAVDLLQELSESEGFPIHQITE